MRAIWLTMLAGLLAAAPLRAEEAAPAEATCQVPAYLLTSESVLSKVAGVVKPGGKLSILVVGSRSSVVGAADADKHLVGFGKLVFGEIMKT